MASQTGAVEDWVPTLSHVVFFAVVLALMTGMPWLKIKTWSMEACNASLTLIGPAVHAMSAFHTFCLRIVLFLLRMA